MDTLNRIQQQLKVPKNNRNSFGNYNYRSCEDILEAVKPLLKGATLTISDEIICIGNHSPMGGYAKDEKGKDKPLFYGGQRFYVKAIATLTGFASDEKTVKTWSSCAFAREPEAKPGMDEAQITGSASSYARKYALNGLFCIDDTKDSDATNTHGKVDMEKLENDIGF